MSNRIILLICLICLILLPVSGIVQSDDGTAIFFDGEYGQIEVGGPYAGAEFHHSLPFPSRISFYYPVANSIDLSTDYWHRGEQSHPFRILLSVDGRTEILGGQPAQYSATPYMADFKFGNDGYMAELSYRFAGDLPLMAMRIAVKHTGPSEAFYSLFINVDTPLRTSHSFTHKNEARLAAVQHGYGYCAYFDDHETDSTVVFILNAGSTLPIWNAAGIRDTDVTEMPPVNNPRAGFKYERTLESNSELEIVLLIGTCRYNELDEVISKIQTSWRESIDGFENQILTYIRDEGKIEVGDAVLEHTARWSKALLKANYHYLDGTLVPMPCPAEYNFYFTHDVLLTNLGAVIFDIERVRNDLKFLHSLTGPDSVLAHAYYWKDGIYLTEYAGNDNWNHLWFVILSASFLKHSADTVTLKALFPVLTKSIRMMLENRRDDLMYASQPDWWDIGNVYGARAYITILMIRALQSYAYISLVLKTEADRAASYLELADQMQIKLVEELWDDNAGYLMNMLDLETWDPHYYTGSLLAAAFEMFKPDLNAQLLDTATEKLLDEHLGIRNAMPPDFHELIDVYNFQGMEAGEPYRYANGGIWPHGTAWYILGLTSAGKSQKALTALKKYLTIDGIRNSPGGQPSFYEYRNADPASSEYGRIDKPTFLWAGGWYLHCLYRLAGVRENPFTLYFSSDLPEAFGDIRYEIMHRGRTIDITYSGTGRYFSEIVWDGVHAYSAVPVGNVSEIVFERGPLRKPYLASAKAQIEGVHFEENENALTVELSGIPGQKSRVDIVSPSEITHIISMDMVIGDRETSESNETAIKSRVDLMFTGIKGSIKILF